jgi:hypothetical protein
MATRWKRVASKDVAYNSDDNLDVVVHYEDPAHVLSNWESYGETGALPLWGTGDVNDFILCQIDQTGTVETDFLVIRNQDWADCDDTNRFVDSGYHERQNWWREADGGTITAGTNETWDYLTYFKPTNLGDVASPWLDTDVTMQPLVVGMRTGLSMSSPSTGLRSLNSQWAVSRVTVMSTLPLKEETPACLWTVSTAGHVVNTSILEVIPSSEV